MRNSTKKFRYHFQLNGLRNLFQLGKLGTAIQDSLFTGDNYFGKNFYYYNSESNIDLPCDCLYINAAVKICIKRHKRNYR